MGINGVPIQEAEAGGSQNDPCLQSGQSKLKTKQNKTDIIK